MQCKLSRTAFLIAIGVLTAILSNAQSPAPKDTRVAVQQFQPRTVTRTVHIIAASRGSSKAILKGTNLAPGVTGQVKIKASEVDVALEVQLTGVSAPVTFGDQYRTYLLWAVTPACKTMKLGELRFKTNRAELTTTTAVRGFGLLVTAEPYAEVVRPQEIVVAENDVAEGAISASCELLADAYAPTGYQFPPLDPSSAGYPPEIVQMFNARRIAQLAGAEDAAPDNYRMAEDLFNSAVLSAQKQKKITTVMLKQAVNATQYYEAARSKAIEKRLRSQHSR